MSTEPETIPPAPPPETAIPDTPEALLQAATARIAALEAERDEMKDRWMRAEAETTNTRTRGKREVDDARQYAVQSFAKDVVEAAENIRRGLDALPAATDNDPDLVIRLRTGFEGVERSFLSLLERHGIARTDPTGTAFDPNQHQAMAEQETTDHPAGTVIQAWTPAWTLHGRLLRAAMVVVAKALAADHPPATEKLDRTA
ncbi:MAG: nucleotide exchange factor GrpE [Acetobacteraceae bacterium]|nr:nucleotide exchange factor GrpE [Acetobacteraceae bacterium]MSP29525.1 nucleotide exchange factor GrpE [Acetobacteraceae bacterium]